MNHNFFYIMWTARCVCYVPKEKDGTKMHHGKKEIQQAMHCFRQ